MYKLVFGGGETPIELAQIKIKRIGLDDKTKNESRGSTIFEKIGNFFGDVGAMLKDLVQSAGEVGDVIDSVSGVVDQGKDVIAAVTNIVPTLTGIIDDFSKGDIKAAGGKLDTLIDQGKQVAHEAVEVKDAALDVAEEAKDVVRPFVEDVVPTAEGDGIDLTASSMPEEEEEEEDGDDQEDDEGDTQ